MFGIINSFNGGISVTIDGVPEAIASITPIPISAEPTQIGDYDSDGISDLMVKFSRSEVAKVVSVGDVKITVSGNLSDGKIFEGSDTIRVINAPYKDGCVRVLKNKFNVSKGEKARIIYKVENNAEVKIRILDMNQAVDFLNF